MSLFLGRACFTPLLRCDPPFIFTLCLMYSAGSHCPGCSDLYKFPVSLLGLWGSILSMYRLGFRLRDLESGESFSSVELLPLSYSGPRILAVLTVLNTNFSFLHSGKLLNSGCLLPTVQPTNSP